MNILFTRFPLESIRNGGAEKQTLALMLGLRERGHAVSFAGSCRALIDMCREHRITAMEYYIGPPPVTLWHAISFLWRRRTMKRHLRYLMFDLAEGDQPVDVVVMLSLSGKLLLTDIAKKAGAKVFWIEHDRVGDWLKKNPWLRSLLGQSKQAQTIVVSELSRNIYRKIGWPEDRLVAIPNGIEAPKPTFKTLATLHAPLSTRLTCIARLSPEKGIDVLIAAVATLADVHLEIVGTGPEEQHLEALAKASNMQDRIAFTPRVHAIDDAYSRTDVLILPSREHDPFGLTAAEAMMRGIPVIVTDQCGISSYLTDGTDALVVKAGDIEVLRGAIAWLQSPENRKKIGEVGQKTAQKKFTLERMVDEYEKMFSRS